MRFVLEVRSMLNRSIDYCRLQIIAVRWQNDMNYRLLFQNNLEKALAEYPLTPEEKRVITEWHKLPGNELEARINKGVIFTLGK
jgi:hypothetical protein